MKKLSPDITDEELHEAFREAAGAWPAPAGSAEKDAGWEKMQAKLTAIRNAAVPPSRTDTIRRRSKLVMVLLLWAMMVTCWMMQPGTKKTAHENKISGGSDILKSSGTLTEKQLSKTAPGPAGKRNLHQPLHSKSEEINGGKVAGASGAAAEQKNSGHDAAGNEQKIAGLYNRENVPGHSGSVTAEHKQQNAVQDEEENEQIGGLNKAENTQSIQQQAGQFAIPGDSISEPVMNSMDAGKNPAVQKEITKTNAPDAKTKKRAASKPKESAEKQKNKSGFARWAVGLTLGPDWSMVAGKSQTRPGLDKGITIRYRISRKWSLETGILLASKIYSARPEDYHSVNPYPNATGIDASCQVIDLPLNIRYNIWQPEKDQVFVLAGLSSFWMQKESYLFTYDANAASPTSETNIYHQNRHLLSIANMALGYEHAWGKISIEASPYIKIPLSGIGYGRVKLFSTGILASVKYNF